MGGQLGLRGITSQRLLVVLEGGRTLAQLLVQTTQSRQGPRVVRIHADRLVQMALCGL